MTQELAPDITHFGAHCVRLNFYRQKCFGLESINCFFISFTVCSSCVGPRRGEYESSAVLLHPSGRAAGSRAFGLGARIELNPGKGFTFNSISCPLSTFQLGQLQNSF